MRAIHEELQMDPVVSFRCTEWQTDRDDQGKLNWHLHPEYELVLTAQDRGRRFVGDHIGRYVDEDLVLLGPLLPHGWVSDARADRRRIVVVHFARDWLGAGWLDLPEMRSIAAVLDRAARGVQVMGRTRGDVIGRMRQMLATSGPRLVILLLEVLERLARSHELRSLSSLSFAPAVRRDDQRSSLICAHIANHFRERLSLPQVAAMAHLSPSAFSRFFKRCTGTTFVAYVNTRRIGRACQLLATTDQSITAVCFEAGFRNLAHFNREFHRAKRMTPREYRRLVSG